jgi:hypothetical protein
MEAWLTDVTDTTNLQSHQLRFLLEGGAHRKRKHRSDASASTANSKGRRTVASSNLTAADRLGVDDFGCMCVEMFFDAAESGSEQSEDEGSHCEPNRSSREQPLDEDQLGKMQDIVDAFVRQPRAQ